MTRFRPNLIVTTLLCSGMAIPFLGAADLHDDALPRVGAEIMLGTSGAEPGLFAEWRLSGSAMLVRPEVFLNEDERVGAAASLAWEPEFLHLPERQHLGLGPRVIYHNSDDHGWEVDLMAMWSFDLVPAQRGRHYLEVLGAIGALQEDNHHDDSKDTVLGASIGIGYGYQF